MSILIFRRFPPTFVLRMTEWVLSKRKNLSKFVLPVLRQLHIVKVFFRKSFSENVEVFSVQRAERMTLILVLDHAKGVLCVPYCHIYPSVRSKVVCLVQGLSTTFRRINEFGLTLSLYPYKSSSRLGWACKRPHNAYEKRKELWSPAGECPSHPAWGHSVHKRNRGCQWKPGNLGRFNQLKIKNMNQMVLLIQLVLKLQQMFIHSS